MAADERIIIVDEENREIGLADRARMRSENLIHRATYILVFNDSGQLFVQKRTLTKDIYPGYFEIAAGGVVAAGEGYEESARRELQEELGIAAKELTCHFDNFYDTPANRVWGRVYSCVHNGPMILQETEVASGQFMAIREVEEMMGRERFCPDGELILQRYLKKIMP
ncbi:MAG: NUDIX hydrolase YfcD [Thermodesulfobacteriota bacterium]